MADVGREEGETGQEKRMGGKTGEEDGQADKGRGQAGRWETFWGGSGNILINKSWT